MSFGDAIRSWVRWGSTLATAGLVLLWAGSGRGYAGYVGDDYGAALFAGQLEVSWRTGPGGMPYNYAGREGWVVSWGSRWEWRLGVEYFGAGMGSRSVVYLPVWAATPLTLAVALVSWRPLKRRVPRAEPVCPRCGYSRAGIDARRLCPECGSAGAGG